MPADYNVDARPMRFSVHRQARWIILPAAVLLSVSFGATGDIPVTGDLTATAKPTSLFRTSTEFGISTVRKLAIMVLVSELLRMFRFRRIMTETARPTLLFIAARRNMGNVQTSGPGADITEVWGNYGTSLLQVILMATMRPILLFAVRRRGFGI